MAQLILEKSASVAAEAERSGGATLGPRLAVVALVASLTLMPACRPSEIEGTDATPEICTDAWNRGVSDGTPVPEGQLHSSTSGLAYGLVGRRVAVWARDATSCIVVFDTRDGTFWVHSVGSGEPPPFSPGLAGWTHEHVIRSTEDLEFSGGSWNACQNADGRIVLLAKGSCTPVPTDARPTPVIEILERRAARNFVAAEEALPHGAHGFWLGTRFRGALGEANHAERGGRVPDPTPVPGGADFEAAYSPWRGLDAEDRRVGPYVLRITVLTYLRRLGRVPGCLLRSGRRCLLVPVLRLQRGKQTVIVGATNGAHVPASLLRDVRRCLTSRPGFSEVELEETEFADSTLGTSAMRTDEHEIPGSAGARPHRRACE